MIFELYSYRDKLNGFGPPILETNQNTAIRGFSCAVNNGTGMMGYSPSDYDLCFVGKFDIEKGVIEAEPVPKFVVNGSSVFSDKE